MKRSWLKSLAAIASDARRWRAGSRAGHGKTHRRQASHETVDYFLGNAQGEAVTVNGAFFHELRPAADSVVLADWAKRNQQLVLALPRNALQLPFAVSRGKRGAARTSMMASWSRQRTLSLTLWRTCVETRFALSSLSLAALATHSTSATLK